MFAFLFHAIRASPCQYPATERLAAFANYYIMGSRMENTLGRDHHCCSSVKELQSLPDTKMIFVFILF